MSSWINNVRRPSWTPGTRVKLYLPRDKFPAENRRVGRPGEINLRTPHLDGSAFRLRKAQRIRVPSSPSLSDLGRVFAVRPWSGELLPWLGNEFASLVAGFPAGDLGRLAALVASLFPHRRPRRISRDDLSAVFIEEQRFAFAV